MATKDQVIKLVCESKLHAMAQTTAMTRIAENGTRETVTAWFERTQRRIFLRDAGNADGPVKTVDVSSIVEVSEEAPNVSAREAERLFVLATGDVRYVFLAESEQTKCTWVDGLTLACNFEDRMRPALMNEVGEMFGVMTELDVLRRQMETLPALPQRPENLDFVGGPISVKQT